MKCKDCGAELNSNRKKYCDECKQKKNNQYNKEYYKKNKFQLDNATYKYREQKKEQYLTSVRKYRMRNIEKYREYERQRYRKRKEKREQWKYGREWKEQCINCEENINDTCKFAQKKITYLTKKECKNEL